jgi:lipid A 3-O-deacylase PagL
LYVRKRSVVLSLASFFCTFSAFPQSGEIYADYAHQASEETFRLVRETKILDLPTFSPSEYSAHNATTPTPWGGHLSASEPLAQPDASLEESPGAPGNKPAEGIQKLQPTNKKLRNQPADFNREIYYRNKLEFSLDGGWLPINIPFPLDIFVGDNYNTYPLKYTLVPIIASLRWQLDSVGSPWILRGNWDLTFSGSITAIPRGPETHYFSYDMGIRRNFVQRNWRAAPYFDVRLGVGRIDAKGPEGVLYAQGQDITFTVNMGSGVRYNFNPRYAISAGLNFMHISNLDLSESNGKPNWGVRNYGINVYGPMVGLDIQLRRHPRQSAR